MTAGDAKGARPLVFLATQALLARLAYAARKTPTEPKTMITFWEGLIPSEVAHWLLTVDLVILASFIKNCSETQAAALPGLTGVALGGYAAAEFYKALRENLGAHEAFADALNAAGITPQFPEMDVRKWLASLLILPKFGGGGTTIQEVAYGTGSSMRKADVYVHRGAKPNAPVFLYIHGGGWVTGDKKYHSKPLLFQIAHAGWIVVSINYRLAPKYPYPESLMDCKRALCWIRRGGLDKFNANKSQVIVGGESAGGHLSLMMTLTANFPEYQREFPDVDTSVSGCVDLYGVCDFTDHQGIYANLANEKINFRKFLEKLVLRKRYAENVKAFEDASPILLLNRQPAEKIPPIFIAHGMLDNVVPIEDSQLFFRALQEVRKRSNVSSPDVLVQLKGAHHAFNFFMSPRSLVTGYAVKSFMRHVLDTSTNSVRSKL